jgi:hypothetical protein
MTDHLKLFVFYDGEDNFLTFAVNEYAARQVIRQDYGFESTYALDLWGEYEIKEGEVFRV